MKRTKPSKVRSKKSIKNERGGAQISRRRSFLNPGLLILLGLVVVMGGYVFARYSHAATSSSTSTSRTPSHWLMTSNLVSDYVSQQTTNAHYFMDTTKAFEMNSSGSTVAGVAALPVRNYKSYTQFAKDISHNAIPSGVHWVMYDNENWSYTPAGEAQQPAKYMKLFADMAHQHGLKVIEVPARDLMSVSGAACRQSGGESIDQAYMRCQIPADARYADVYEVQAQADQGNVSAYSKLVSQARAQVKTYSPSITFMAGLTTDRGDTVAQIVNCWKASHTMVSGYWMNSTNATFGVARSAMAQIRSYGG